MLSLKSVFPWAAASIAVASITLAAVSWARMIGLSLPIPAYLPVTSMFFSALIVVVVPAFQHLSNNKKKLFRSISSYATSISGLVLSTLFVLSLVFALPSDIQSCAADRQWLRLFEQKNDIAVRQIQSSLHCCGYNSMRDRAWPFPSKDVDARTCERTQGYFIACGGLWRQEQQAAAAMSAAASLLNWLLMILLTAFPAPTEGIIQLPGREAQLEAGKHQRPQLMNGSVSGDTRPDQRSETTQPRGTPGSTDETDNSDARKRQAGDLVDSQTTNGITPGEVTAPVQPTRTKGAPAKKRSFNAGASEFVPGKDPGV